MFVVFFFFKQKTAYEMRISDWSSDVCSSDLVAGAHRGLAAGRVHGGGGRDAVERAQRREQGHLLGNADHFGRQPEIRIAFAGRIAQHAQLADRGLQARSEEHTSELQSLMRISYAVFCLKKKKQTQTPYQYPVQSDVIIY